MLILGDAVYQGNISLGTFMQISAAYQTVTGGLTMLIQRWVEFNELLSVVRRLNEHGQSAQRRRGDRAHAATR